MIDRADVLLLTAVGLVLMGGIVAAHVTLHRDRARVQKYPLYRIRDKLVYLVASGRLDENDFIFQSFYGAANHLIKRTSTINLKTFVSALEEARRNGLDPAMKERRDRIERELKAKDDAVIAVVGEFYQIIVAILMENSWFLRAIRHYAWLRRLLAKLASVCAMFRPTERNAYRFYQDYARAAGVM
jgi:hypothetical protein